MRPDEAMRTEMDDGELVASDVFQRLGLLVIESRVPHPSPKGRIQGPHCPASVGDTSKHDCRTKDFMCERAASLHRQMGMLWRNQIPMCIEVLLYSDCAHGQQRAMLVEPAASRCTALLLEQWTIQPLPPRSCEAIVRPRELFQAIKSYLFFSQMSAWLNQSQGTEPTSVAYRISPPGEFCTSSFSEPPDWHIFPLCTLGRGLALKISVGSLPRRPLIPPVLCPETEGVTCPQLKNKSPDDDESSHGAKAADTRPKKLPMSAEPRNHRRDTYQQHTPARRHIRPLAIKTPTADAMPLQNFQVRLLPPASDLSLPGTSQPSKESGAIPKRPQPKSPPAKQPSVRSSQRGRNSRSLSSYDLDLGPEPPPGPAPWHSIGRSPKVLLSKKAPAQAYYPCEEPWWAKGIAVSDSTDSDGSSPEIDRFLKDLSCKAAPLSPEEIQTYLASLSRPHTHSRQTSPLARQQVSLLGTELSLKKTVFADGMPILAKPTPLENLNNHNDSARDSSSKECFPCVAMGVEHSPDVPEKVYFSIGDDLDEQSPSGPPESPTPCDPKPPVQNNLTKAQLHSNNTDTAAKPCHRDLSPSKPDSSHSCGVQNGSSSASLEATPGATAAEPEARTEKLPSPSAISPSPAITNGAHREAAAPQVQTNGTTAPRPVRPDSWTEKLPSAISPSPAITNGAHREAAAPQVQTNGTTAPRPVRPDSWTEKLPSAISPSPAITYGAHREAAAPQVQTNGTTAPRPVRPDNLSNGARAVTPDPSADTDSSPPSACHPTNTSPAFLPNGGLLRTVMHKELNQQMTECTLTIGARRVPSAEEKAAFRKSLDNSAHMMFHQGTGLPLQSSPAPIKKRTDNCFDYDSDLTSVRAIKNSLSCANLDKSTEDEADGKESNNKRFYSTSAPASTNSLLGNFEESLLNGRIEPSGVVEGFTAEVGASGLFCPKHVSLPVTAFFFNLSDDNAPSPYLGHINLDSLGKRGYHVPKKGTVQVTLFNPNKMVVKMFVVLYDLSDMPANCQTFLRQRSLYMPVRGSDSDREGQPVYLRYLIHLRFSSSKTGKIYLHTDIRLIFAREKLEYDSRVANYELRSFTEGPTNPKFSPKR